LYSLGVLQLRLQATPLFLPPVLTLPTRHQVGLP
jgi:hypothetical protein